MSSPYFPPSDRLIFKDGFWCSDSATSVSYPEYGNNLFFQIENESFWFSHRKNCILEALKQFSPGGTIYDIGGGNGFMTLQLQNAGFTAVLLEPGNGVHNAAMRGIRNIIKSTLTDSGIYPSSLTAACAFDVLEHTNDDLGILGEIRGLLSSGGRFYCTVPAHEWLWSREDVTAEHHRRYSLKSLTRSLKNAGMQIEYITSIFSWLLIPVLLIRALPFRMNASAQETMGDIHHLRNDHRLPTYLSGLIKRVHDWELRCIRRKKQIATGTSLLCVARVL